MKLTLYTLRKQTSNEKHHQAITDRITCISKMTDRRAGSPESTYRYASCHTSTIVGCGEVLNI